MRVRALTSIFLLAAWLLPATGGACPSEAREGVGHSHAHAAAAPEQTHDPASHDHGGHHHGSRAVAGERQADSGSTSDEPTCCARAADTPVFQATLKEAKPRPDLSKAMPAAVVAAIPSPAPSLTGAEFRRRQPPPLPYAHSRRPLLI